LRTFGKSQDKDRAKDRLAKDEGDIPKASDNICGLEAQMGRIERTWRV
jgi:hypothetical protein